jgi:hypothetical protein
MPHPKVVLRKECVGARGPILAFLGIFATQVAGPAAHANPPWNDFAVEYGPAFLTRVGLPTFQVEDIQADAGIYVPVRITLPSADELAREGGEEGTFILVRNVPQNVSLSAGLPTGRVWVVTLPQAKTLRLTTTADTAGKFDLEFYLIGPGNRVLAQQTVAVTVRGAEGTNQLSQQVEESPTSTASIDAPDAADPAPPSTPPISAEEETILLKRGDEILRQGAVAAARLIFEELATRGSQKGAFALARTYDPAYVRDSPELGLAPDIELALKWYDRAAELGSAAAKQRRIELVAGR